MAKKEDNPKYVTVEDCTRQVATCQAELRAMKNALVGEDMRGGLVADVQQIKTATSAIKTILVPIVTSICAAIITYLVLNVL